MKNLQLINHPKKGRRIIATDLIKAGAIIEVAPVKPLNEALTWRDPLFEYSFEWQYKDYVEAIAFGVVSFVNRSASPNATLEFNFEDETITLLATKIILPREEITINYNMQPWFQQVA